MNKETKRSITYTVLTLILVMVAVVNGSDENESLIAFTCGLLSVVSGFVAMINILDAIKSKVSVQG